jgi:uncharacterized protein YbjT (DUF2867 family)
VAGATGLVGQEILAGLLTDKRYSAVHCVGRRPVALKSPKLFNHVVDFKTLSALADVDHIDDAYIALGTTIKAAGSQTSFRAVDFDAVVAVARMAKAAGATKLGVVSAMGADVGSVVFYNRVKGEMESALAQLGFRSLVIARPSMLDGNRNALEQPTRPGEKWGLMTMKILRPLIPANYRAISAKQVAHALLMAVDNADKGMRVLLSGQLQSARPR